MKNKVELMEGQADVIRSKQINVSALSIGEAREYITDLQDVLQYYPCESCGCWPGETDGTCPECVSRLNLLYKYGAPELDKKPKRHKWEYEGRSQILRSCQRCPARYSEADREYQWPDGIWRKKAPPCKAT